MGLDIGYYHIGKHDSGGTKQFFTVDDGGSLNVYQKPYGASAKDIRTAIAVAFIDEQDYALEYKVTGRYPNYVIEEVKA